MGLIYNSLPSIAVTSFRLDFHNACAAVGGTCFTAEDIFIKRACRTVRSFLCVPQTCLLLKFQTRYGIIQVYENSSERI